MRNLLFFAAFFTLSTLSHAQNIGLRVGLNMSQLKLDENTASSLNMSQESLRGLAFAIPIEFRVHKNVSIQTELGFLYKGFKSIQNVRNGSATISTELKNYTDYANIPVMVKLHNASRLIQVYINVGPDAAWKLKSRQEGVTTTADGSSQSIVKTENDITLSGQKRLILGLQGGAGMKIQLGKVGLVLDGRFLTNLKNEDNSFNIEGLKEKANNMQTWMTSIGLVFGL